MQKSLFVKAVLVAITFAVLMLPLSMIRGIVAERAARQQAVVHDISASSFGKQMFAGLVLSLPYTEEYDDEVGDARERRIERRRIDRALRFFPAVSEMSGTVSVGEKHRGLFKVRTFTWQAGARGEFVLDGRASIERNRVDSRIVWGQPILSVGLTDPRGLVGA